MQRRFQLIDVFGQQAFSGNPLAVVLDAEDLATEQMQAITRWFNHSETSFLLPPIDAAADYRVRIFTLERELPFAGHPTLGSCHAWLAAGGRPRDDGKIVQECGAGLVAIRRQGSTLAFAAPPLIRGGEVEEEKLAEITQVLRIERAQIVDAQWADNGPGWVAVLLESAQAVLEIKPARHHPRRLEIGLVGLHPPGGEAAVELRALFSDQHGALLEDPATGSLNASVAQWLLATGRLAAPYVTRQGTCIGRAGRIEISHDEAGAVWVGGRTRTLFQGTGSF